MSSAKEFIESCTDEKGIVRSDVLAQDPDMDDATDVEDCFDDDLRDLKEAVGVIQHDLEHIKRLLQELHVQLVGGRSVSLSSSIGMAPPVVTPLSTSETASGSCSEVTMSVVPQPSLLRPLVSQNTPKSTPKLKYSVQAFAFDLQPAKM